MLGVPLSDDPVIAVLLTADSDHVTVAATRGHTATLLGPFAAPAAEPERPPLSHDPG